MRVRTPREGQVLGEVEQLLGDRRMMVRCADKHARVCRIPGKIRRRIWIKEGDIVL
ncbi:MAG: translation initiation factor IF-1A, partial [Candidatus Altiarchaeota archaeon]|nr:translation initiation factor IF-1A [Candidatus Altiarchaeota archaeon]